MAVRGFKSMSNRYMTPDDQPVTKGDGDDWDQGATDALINGEEHQKDADKAKDDLDFAAFSEFACSLGHEGHGAAGGEG